VAAASSVLTQTAFVDSAKRRVQLPARVSRVFAGGMPADVLLYTLVPEMLVGRNRPPEGEMLEYTPARYRSPVLIKQLPEVDNPDNDAELVALKADVYVDYGTVDADYTAVVEAVQRRTRVAGVLLDGALPLVPDTYRRLGAALGVKERGDRLAASAERLLAKYRGALASGTRPRVYLACTNDGQMPCLSDQTAGEQLEWLGGINVAGRGAASPRRALTIAEIAALRPDVVIVNGNAGTAARFRGNTEWNAVDAVAAGRVYQWPALPFNWGSRPPSVNRLPGLVWLRYVAAGRPFDAAAHDDLRAVFREFYHHELTDAQLERLLAL
jgi:iron complex transport system substrate-binding protein